MKKNYFLKSIISFIVISLALAAPAVFASANPYTGLTGAIEGTNLKPDMLVFVGGLIKAILSLVGVALVIVVIYAGISWGFLSAQDPKKIQSAKEMLKNAIIGLVVVFAAYAITNTVIRSISSAATGNVNTAL